MRDKKNGRTGDIKGILGNVINKIQTKNRGVKKDILTIWNSLAGDNVNRHARPLILKKKVLIVEVDSSSWLYELSLKKSILLQEMQKKTGADKIQDIRFRMGEL
jgi:predicted nucleic acid-binding Zn ribbon protein